MYSQPYLASGGEDKVGPPVNCRFGMCYVTGKRCTHFPLPHGFPASLSLAPFGDPFFWWGGGWGGCGAGLGFGTGSLPSSTAVEEKKAVLVLLFVKLIKL